MVAMAHSHTLDETRPVDARDLARIRAWLLVVAALVFVMVSIGGATRLTGSGLSITEWQPIVGTLPPLSQADWLEAFAKYRQIPQYEHVNRGMSLEAFKVIFWWEWTHRFLGRLIGAAFLLPFLYFLAAGRISRALAARLAGIFALGALQGAVGWYMVRSGLADRIDVSQYRLALHLGLAILIFGALIWVALSLDRRRDSAAWSPQAIAAGLIVLLVFVQIELGALVAGLKAGAGYNTWPLMDGRLVPSGLGAMQPWYLNLFENALDRAVQPPRRGLRSRSRRALACVERDARNRWRSHQGIGRRACCRSAGSGGARRLDPARAGAAGAGACAPGGGGSRIRRRGVAPARGAARRAADRAMSGLVLVFDLDDTLYPERQFALSGFEAAGRWAAAELGIEGLAADMTRLLDDGHLGQLFRMALAEKMPEHRPEHLAGLLEAYRDHEPELALFDDAGWALAHFAGQAKLGLITDGTHRVQAKKVDGARHRPALPRDRVHGCARRPRLLQAASQELRAGRSGRWARRATASSTSATTHRRTSSCRTRGAGPASWCIGPSSAASTPPPRSRPAARRSTPSPRSPSCPPCSGCEVGASHRAL